MSGTKSRTTNFSTSYVESNITSYRKAGLNSINSVAYNGNYWIIGGDESRKRLIISSYVGVMNGLKKVYEFNSRADSLEIDDTSNESAIEFFRGTSDNFKSFCDTEYALQKSLFKPETLFEAGTTHTMAISYDGRSWNLIDSNPFAYNNYIPQSTYSEGGVTVQNYANSTGIRPKCNGIAWNGSFWIAVGSTRTVATNIDFQLRYWDGMKFEARDFKPLSCISTSTDGLNWKQQPFFKIELNCVAASNDIIVVGGPQISDSSIQQPYSCLATSTDGEVWTVTTSQSPIRICRGIAYNGVVWVAVGEGGLDGSDNLICTSTNGTNWIGRLGRNGTTRKFNGVAWNGDKWLAVGELTDGNGILGTSTNGTSWTVTNFSTKLNTVSWDGGQWIVGGSDGVFTSIDGIFWSFIPETDDNIIFSSATTVVLPLLDVKIDAVDSLLVGLGNPSGIYASSDSIVWQERTPNILRNNESTKSNVNIKSVIWDGSQWIIAGSFGLLDSFYKSTDANDWTSISLSTSRFDNTNDIYYNGSLYVAVTNSIFPNFQIYTSSNASSWTPRTSTLGDSRCIAYNSTKWVIGGQNGIQYSSNGTNWTKSSTCPLTLVNKIVWNGYLWIAVGSGPGSSIATSIDGMRWYPVKSSSPLLFTEGTSVSWSKSIWVAFGIGSQNTIATSVDGYNWIGRGNSVFGNSADFVAWNGTNFLGFGDASIPYVKSTDGISWTYEPIGLTRVTAFANKTLTLPITGVSNNALLTDINIAVSAVTSLTNVTIAEEEAAAALAADIAAQLALQAQKTTSINDISLKRIHILYWNYRITNETIPLKSTTYIDLKGLYPYDFYLTQDLVIDIQEFVKEIEPLYSKLTPTLATDQFDDIINFISGRHTELFARLPEYYNSCRILYTHLLNATYDSLTSTVLSGYINDWGFSTTTKIRLIAFYDVKKNAYNTLVTNAITSINTDLTSITMSYNTNSADYSFSTESPGFTFNPSTMFVVQNSDFVNKPISGDGSVISKSVSYNNGLIPVTISIIKLLKPSGGDILDIYQTVASLSDSFTTTQTYETDGSNALRYLTFRKKAFETLKPIKDKCDEYYEKSSTEAQKWLDVISGTADQSSIDADFSPIYNKYFYDLDDDSTMLLVPASYIGTTQIPAKYKYAERIFQVMFDKYGNISVYPSVSQNIKSTFDSKFNEVNTQRVAAETYSRTKLTQFFNQYRRVRLWPGIYDFPESEIEMYCRLFNEQLSDQQRSMFKRLEFNRFSLIKIIDFGETVQNMISAIKIADIEAEEDGAKPPITGWGGKTNGLSPSDIGSPGVNGWNLFNETYRVRDIFSNFLGTQFGFTEVAQNSKSVQDFLTYLTDSTPDGILNFRNQVVAEFDAYLDDNKFETEYIDEAFTNSVTAFITSYRSRIKTSLLDSLNFRVSLELPSQSDLENYGYLMVGSSTTLSEYVADVLDGISDITTVIQNENITTYTFSQLQTFGESVTNSINTLAALVSGNAAAYNLTKSDIRFSKESIVRFNEQQLKFRKSIDRFQRAKNNVLNNPSFPIGELADEYGNDFILSVLPTNEFYWKERTATVVLDPVSNGFLEAEYDDIIGQYKIIDPLNISDYSSYSSTSSYVKYDRVSFNGKIYECIKDNTNTSSSTIIGVDPTIISRWKQIEYPYVEYLNETIEAKPQNLLRLVPAEFNQYNNEDKYREGSYVSYNSKVYYCIKDFSKTKTLKGVTPPNVKYWQPIVYPRVTYSDRFNFATVEGSPTNLIEFNPDDFQLVNSLKRYYNGDVVTYITTSLVKRIYKCIATAVEGVLVADPTAISINPDWQQLTYPSVLFNGSIVNAGTVPFPIPALNIADINDYNSSVEYTQESLVKVGGIIYVCLVSTGSDVQNILPTNTSYWREVNFPLVNYNSKLVEATPLTIPKLNASDYDLYSPTTAYVKNDKVSFNGLIYECYYDQPIQTPITNITPTITENWTERRYNVLFDVYGNEFEPTPNNLKALDELDYHLYDNNFLYYYGDIVSYNSKVYQCINVENPDVTPLVISNVDVTDTNVWQKQDIDLRYISIFKWSPFAGYSNGSIVTFESNFYQCVLSHSRTSTNPFVNITNWAKISTQNAIKSAAESWIQAFRNEIIQQGFYLKIQSSREFVLSDTYSQGELVFKITNTETDTTADFYQCITTTSESLAEYNYAEIILNGKFGSDGFEQYDIDNKTWLSHGLPRHGTGYVVDPFRIPHFAFKLRRRVATSFELQLQHAQKTFFEVSNLVNTISLSGGIGSLKAPLSNPNVFINGLANLNALMVEYDGITGRQVSTDLYLHAYAKVYEQLALIKETVISYRSAVNVMKTQYFNNPNIQARIYKDPYPFLNYVAASLNPPKQQFKDLGVGDIDDINYELDVKRSQLVYTPASRTYYYEKQAIIDDYDEKIAQLVALAKYLIAYPVAFQLDNSESRMGGTIYCDSVRFGGIDIPICGFEDINYVNGEGSPNNIFRYIHDIMTEAVRPPEYVTDTNLASALTWESNNSAVKGLTSVAKGLVGLTAAAFENFTSPTAVFELVELAGQIARWDFETKILTFVPEIKYPNFRDLAENRVLFKQAVKIQQQVNSLPLREEEIEGIRTTVGRLTGLLLLAKLDLRTVQRESLPSKTTQRVVDNIVPDVPDVPIPTPVKPVAPTPSPREVLVPPEPPKRIVPGAPPRKPQNLKLICVRNLHDEVLALTKQIEDLETTIKIEKKVPRKVPFPSDISSNVVQDAKKTGVSGFKFDVDRNGYRHRGAGNFVISGNSGQSNPFRFLNGGNPSAVTKPLSRNTAAIVDGFDQIRSQNEVLVYDTIVEETRKGTDAEIQAAKNELSTRNNALSAAEFENEARRAANAESMKTYKDDLVKSTQELREAKIKNAQNQAEYEASKRDFDAKTTAITAQEKADYEAKRNKFVQSRNNLASRELVATQKRVAFQEALLEEPGFKGLINTKLGISIRAKYASAINSVVNSTMYKAISESYRRSYVALTNTKGSRAVAKLGKKLPFRVDMIGPLAEIAGIGLLAWQNGAFTDE